MSKFELSRRTFLTRAAIGGSGLMLAGCKVLDGLDRNSWVRRTLESANNLTYRLHRALSDQHTLAREYSEADIRQAQRPNGSTSPDDDDYQAMVANNFADWRLEVSGLVEKPLLLSLA